MAGLRLIHHLGPILVSLVIGSACGGADDEGAGAQAGAAGAGIGGSGNAGAGGTGGGGAGGGACAPDFAQPEVGVETFGAIGDGVSDDTQALMAAFTHLEQNGGTLVLESGKAYLVSDRLQLTDATDFGIRGNGATIQVADGTPTDSHNPLSLRNCSSFAVADLTIDGNRDNRIPAETGGGHNVRLTGCSDWELCRVKSDNSTTDGFYVSPLDNADPTTFPRDGVMRDCHADNNFRQGMSIINGRRLQVIDSSFTHTNGTSPQAGVDIEPNSGSASPGAEHILFRGCLFEGNEGYGLTMGGHATTDRLTVEDSTFRANIHGALTVRAGWALVQHNVVEDHTSWVGLNLRGEWAHDVVVRDNTFRNNSGIPDSGDAWIYVDSDSGSNNFLLENVFENNEDQDIANNNPSGCCAAGNLIDGELDAPADMCGPAPTDIGFGSGA